LNKIKKALLIKNGLVEDDIELNKLRKDIDSNINSIINDNFKKDYILYKKINHRNAIENSN